MKMVAPEEMDHCDAIGWTNVPWFLLFFFQKKFLQFVSKLKLLYKFSEVSPEPSD